MLSHRKIIAQLRTTYDHKSDNERAAFENQQAEDFFRLMDQDAPQSQKIRDGLVNLLDLTRLSQHLPLGSNGLQNSFNNLKSANNPQTLQRSFLGLLCLPFGMNHINTQHHQYERARDSARKMRNNCCDRTNTQLFTGTCHQPYVSGFSMHSYTFAIYVAINMDAFNGLDAQTLDLVILFFYYSYINNKTRFHSFAEVDAAFLRAAEDAQCKKLILGGEIKASEEQKTIIEAKNNSNNKSAPPNPPRPQTPPPIPLKKSPPQRADIEALFKSAITEASTHAAANTPNQKAKKHFVTTLKNLRDKTLREADKGSITWEKAEQIANSTTALAQNMGAPQPNQQSINNFLRDTKDLFEQSFSWRAILGAVLGAALGIILGAMIGAATGPGAALTALGCGMKGALIGATLFGISGALGGAGLGILRDKQQEVLAQTAMAASALAA